MEGNSRPSTRPHALVILFIACLTLAPHTLPAAQTDSTPKRIVIPTSDLDLSQPQDIEVLYRRILRAARHLCSDGVTELYLQVARTRKFGCYRASIDATVARANLPRLTALHQRNAE